MALVDDKLPKAVVDTIATYLQDKPDGATTYVPTLFEEFGKQI